MIILNTLAELGIRGLSTVGEVASTVYPEMTYDTALPQEWVDAVTRRGFDPRGHVVWGYPKGSLGGQPYPITVTGLEGLCRLAGGVS
jgi:hypothetical protein